jgi:ATP-dependent DNA helicase RecQ
LNYYIEDVVDEYAREEIYDYFMEAETDELNTAFQALKEDDIRYEEVQLVRLKFLSDVCN